MGRRRLNLSGKTVGIFHVIEFSGMDKDQRSRWLCECFCGKRVILPGSRIGKHKSCGCLQTLSKSTAAKNQLYSVYRHASNSRNLEFNLSKDNFEVITKSNCYYCGVSPYRSHHPHRVNGEYIYNGIDRVDNTLGYSNNNCVPCCLDCNRAKHAMTVTEWENWLQRIINYQLTNNIKFDNIT